MLSRVITSAMGVLFRFSDSTTPFPLPGSVVVDSTCPVITDFRMLDDQDQAPSATLRFTTTLVDCIQAYNRFGEDVTLPLETVYDLNAGTVTTRSTHRNHKPEQDAVFVANVAKWPNEGSFARFSFDNTVAHAMRGFYGNVCKVLDSVGSGHHGPSIELAYLRALAQTHAHAQATATNLSSKVGRHGFNRIVQDHILAGLGVDIHSDKTYSLRENLAMDVSRITGSTAEERNVLTTEHTRHFVLAVLDSMIRHGGLM